MSYRKDLDEVLDYLRPRLQEVVAGTVVNPKNAERIKDDIRSAIESYLSSLPETTFDVDVQHPYSERMAIAKRLRDCAAEAPTQECADQLLEEAVATEVETRMAHDPSVVEAKVRLCLPAYQEEYITITAFPRVDDKPERR